MVNNEAGGEQPDTTSECSSDVVDVTSQRPIPTSLLCSLPLSHDVQSIIDTFPKTEDDGVRGRKPRKLACLYCDRTFVADTLRTKHVERCHSMKQARRSSSRFQHAAAAPVLQCMFCSVFAGADLSDLFRHLAGEHADRYFACVDCEERFALPSQLQEHLEDEHHHHVTEGPSAHMEEKEVRSKRGGGGIKSTKLGIKRSARLLNKELSQQAKMAQKQRKHSGRKPDVEGGDAVKVVGAHENPYPSYDAFYRVKKITDHSIDNLRITSLTFNDVFDQAFYTRIRCNIADNLRNHIDGKLFKNEESESRISNFEKQQAAEMCQSAGESGHFGCEISLNAATPVATLLTSHLGDDPETQIEYASKASKKKVKSDEVHYKYFTRRKYQASIREIKENRDLSKLDMWTQFAVKNRQQAIANDTKSEKERQEYKKSDEYRMKQQNEELNKILDRRGPFEDLKEEAAQQQDGNVSREARMMASVILEHVLHDVFATSQERPELRDAKIPEYLHLQKVSLAAETLVDRSDKITLICSSEETDNFEAPHTAPRDKHALVELTGECTRARLYICAACGLKVGNMRELLDHKGLDHQNVWCQHYEFVGKQGAYYRNLSIPGLGKVETIETSPLCKTWMRSDARVCSKCHKQCNALGELHRHVLECGEDWSWMLLRKKCRYRPFGARRKRRGLFKRQIPHAKEKSNASEDSKEEKKKAAKPNGPRVKPSDAETIERMLANLPPKRATRKIMCLKDGFPRQMRKLDTKSSNAELRKKKKKKTTKLELKQSDNQRKVLVTNKCNPVVGNNRKSVRNLNKVISSALIESNLRMRRRLKLGQVRTGQVREKAMLEPLVPLGDLTDEERAVEVKKKITLLKKVQSLRKSVIKKRTDIKSESDGASGTRTTRSTTTVVNLDTSGETEQTKLYKKIGSKLICGLSLRKKSKDVSETEEIPKQKSEGSVDKPENPKRKSRFGSIKRAVKKLRATNRKVGEKENFTKENTEIARDVDTAVSTDHFLEESFLEKPTLNINDLESQQLVEEHRGPLTSETQPSPFSSTEPISLISQLQAPTSSMKAKNKLCKRAKGLNDCIAMLTSKLTCKTIAMPKNIIDEQAKPDVVLLHDIQELTPNDTTTEEQNVVIPEDPDLETVLESAKEPASPPPPADVIPSMQLPDFSLDLNMTTSLITSLNEPVIEQDKENIELEHKALPKFDKVMEQVMKELNDEQLFNGVTKKSGKLGVRCNVLKKHIETAEFLIHDQLNMAWMEEETFANGSLDRKLGSKRNLSQQKWKKDVSLHDSAMQHYNQECGTENSTKINNTKQVQRETLSKQEPLNTLATNIPEPIEEIIEEHKDNELSEISSHCDNQRLDIQLETIQNPEVKSEQAKTQNEEEESKHEHVKNAANIKHLTLHVEPENESCVLEDKSLLRIREVGQQSETCADPNSDDSEDELPLAELIRSKLPVTRIRESKTSSQESENKETFKEGEEPKSPELSPKSDTCNYVPELENATITQNVQSSSEINTELLLVRPMEDTKVMLQPKKSTRKRKSETQLLETRFNIGPQLPERDRIDVSPIVGGSAPTPTFKRTRNNKREVPELACTPDFSIEATICPNQANVGETLNESRKTAISVYDFAENDDDFETSKLVMKANDKEVTPMKEIQNESFIQTPDLNDSGIVKKLSKFKMKGQRGRGRPKSKRSPPAQSATAASREIFCEICNRSFLRIDSLTKHRRTLTHIAKLSELEALEAEAKKKKEEIIANVLEDGAVATLQASVPCKTIISDEQSKEQSAPLDSKSPEDPIPPKDPEHDKAEGLPLQERNSEDNNSGFSNHEAYNIELVNIISDLKNIHVELTRYKSLGERKSFDSDSNVYTPVPPFTSINPASNLANKTASDEFLKSQLSMLENIIEENKAQFEYMEDDSIESIQDSLQSNKSAICLSDMSIESETAKHIPEFTSQLISASADENTFVKPHNHEAFDEISEDFQKKTSIEELDTQRHRKTLNRDEELFLECCSLLKSSSEMSNHIRGPAIEQNVTTEEVFNVEPPEPPMNGLPEEDFLSDSCPNSPIQGSCDERSWIAHSRDDSESSNTQIHGKKPEVCETNGFLFDDRLGSEESNSADFRKNIDAKFGGLIAEATKNKSPSDKCSHTKAKMEIQTSIRDFTIPLDSKSDSSDIFDLTSDSRKLLTKGAMKVFDSIKVSIPTDDLDMQQVLLHSPTSKRLELNGKQMQFGNKLGLKVTKVRDQRRKAKPSENYLIEREKHYDVYDFEETQDNTDLYLSPKRQQSEESVGGEMKQTSHIEDDSDGQSMNSFSTETESCTSLKISPPPVQGDNLTKKKCVIMGRIFKNAFKSKTDGMKETSPQLDDALDSYIIGGPVEEMVTPPLESPKVKERLKMSEKEMDLLFDKLLQSDNPAKAKVVAEENDVKEMKTQPSPQLIKSNRRRSKKHGDLSDDDFNVSKAAKKRKSRRCHKKTDDGINLEQELKECMGVAGRKSQRKCTSGKQNVFIEYWSSDDSEFEAILKLSMQDTPHADPAQTNAISKSEVKLASAMIENDLPLKADVNEARKCNRTKAKRRQNGYPRSKSRCKSKSPKYCSTTQTGDTVAGNRRKRAAVETLYYWSSSSEDDTENLIEIKSLRDEMDDEEDRPQHGWIVGDSPKKLVTLLAHAKGKKSCNF